MGRTLWLFAAMAWGCMVQARLLPQSPLVLDYHKGPLLTGEEPIKLYLTFYGSFSRRDKSSVRAFLASFSHLRSRPGVPTVSKWWSITSAYTDLYGSSVSQRLQLWKETTHGSYILGKRLKQADISSLVIKSVKEGTFPTDPRGIYLVLTADDVYVEGFCTEICGQHFYTYPSSETQNLMLPYAWVGNSASQCPGFCAWPFAKGAFTGRNPRPLLKAPNGIGVDGMIMAMANVIAGVATNPYGNAYFQGDISQALESAGACLGSFGRGAYPGNPGKILSDRKTGVGYNVRGIKSWKFLVPWIWNPRTLECAGQP